MQCSNDCRDVADMVQRLISLSGCLSSIPRNESAPAMHLRMITSRPTTTPPTSRTQKRCLTGHSTTLTCLLIPGRS